MKTQNAVLQSIFQQYPNQWLDMVDLGRQIGAWAVHSRVADLRTKHCMTIECRQTMDKSTGHRISHYRWVPK